MFFIGLSGRMAASYNEDLFSTTATETYSRPFVAYKLVNNLK